MEEIEIPLYFICPISLQIMKDPVTAITGITYDRESIEHWLFTGKNTSCPVTKQPLPKDSDLTPNHTLRRLIQAWCTANAGLGIDRIPTPKPLLDKDQILKLLREFMHPKFQLKTVKRLELLAAENERNKKLMAETGVPKATLMFLLSCFEKKHTDGVEEALSVLNFIIRFPSSETWNLVREETDRIFKCFTWVLGSGFENHIKTGAVLVLKSIVEKANPSELAKLKPEFFTAVIEILRRNREQITQQGINAALQIMLEVIQSGKNRVKMAETGFVSELIELEYEANEKKTTELVLGILFHLCSCAEGRAKFLSHKAGIFVVSKKINRVSSVANDRAVMILGSICKHSGTKMVLQEMLEVGAVSRLCVLLQLVDVDAYLKDNVRQILRLFYGELKDSPCFGNSQHLR
ncbi:hypothetical protein UlMin_005393 [Ulmus minor]